MSAVEWEIEVVRRIAPVTAHLLSLRLAETSNLPLAAIRQGAPALVRLAPDLGHEIRLRTPELREELSRSGIATIARLMGHALARNLMHRNQYLPRSADWDDRLCSLYAEFLEALVRASVLGTPEDAVVRHQSELRALLRGLETVSPASDEPICADYSPELQLRILGLDPANAAGPILDLGCGEDGALVRHLHSLGRTNAVGIDALCRTAGPLRRGDWHAAPLDPDRWGTIVAHQSLSLHLLRAHLHGPDDAALRHVALYMRVLRSLAPGGRFFYAPALPFLEDLLPPDRWVVRRRDLPIHGPGDGAFQSTCVSALADHAGE
jgi:SAM-dependent methyltransferase